jgi:hypothetical protein
MGQGRGIPATALGDGKGLGAAGTPGVIGGAPVANHRPDKGVACPVQITANRHTVEAPIKQEQPRTDPSPTEQVYQPFAHLDHGGAILDADQGHGKTPALAHDIGRGLGMKVGRAAFGLTAVELFEALMGLTRVRDQGQVNRHTLGSLTQTFGDLSRKQPIQSLL